MKEIESIYDPSEITRPRFRFPGLQPFTQQEESMFFGRQADIENLYKSVLQNACTVIFGKSGIGKTSLINAGLLPKLEKQNKNNIQHEAIPAFRFGAYNEADTYTLTDKLNNALTLTDEELSTNFLAAFPHSIKQTLWYKLKARQYLSHTLNISRSYILIFDQLEQIFTYPAGQIRQLLFSLSDLLSMNLPDIVSDEIEENKAAEKNNLSEYEMQALHIPIPIKLLFAIRSDKLNLITRLSKTIPSILRNIYELLPFSETQAKLAITKPAGDMSDFISPYFYFDDKAISYIIDYENPGNTEAAISSEERSIEPFNLQIICSHIEKKLRKPEDNGKVITVEHIGPLENIINEHFTDTMRSNFADEAERNEVMNIISTEFIDEKNKIRKMVYGQDLGAHEGNIQKLCKTGLFRMEMRSTKEVYYELSHDRLIEPILKETTNQYLHIKQQGDIFYSQNKYEEAIRAYSQYLETVKKSNVPVTNEVYKARGDAYAKTKKYKLSNDDYENVLKTDLKDFSVLYNIALNYISLNEDDKVKEYFEKAIELNPDYAADLYNGIGNTYYGNKLYSTARYYYEKAISANPKYYYAHFNLGLVEYNESKAEAALEKYKKTISIAPEYKVAYKELAALLIRLKRGNEAVEYLSKIIEIDPADSDAYNDRGYIYAENKQLENAKGDFEKAIMYNSTDYKAFYNLGLTEYKLGNKKGALENYNRTVQINPGYAPVYNTLGNIFLDDKNYIRAKENYEKTISLDLTYYYAYYNLGLIEYREKNFEAALNNYRKAIEVAPDFIDAHKGMADTLKELKRFEEALIHFKLVVDIDPASAVAHNDLGNAYFAVKNYEEAKHNYTKATQLDPGFYYSFYNLGLSEHELKNTEAALIYYRKAVEIQPDYQAAFKEMADILRELKRADEAIIVLQKIIKLDPAADAYNNLGNAYFDKADYTNAIRNYQTATSIDPGHYFAYFNLGLCEYHLKHKEAALSYFKTSIEISPDYDKAHKEIANLLNEEKRYDEAAIHLQKIVEVAPSADAYIDLGITCVANKQYEKAKESYEKALSIDPEYYLSYYYLGLLNYITGNLDESEKNHAKAIELNPRFEKAYFEIGSIKIDENNFDEAVGYLETAIKLNPDYSDAYINLGHSYIHLNPFKKAEEFFEKAISKITPNDENSYIAYSNLAEAQIKLEKYEEAIVNCNKAIELHPEFEEVYKNAGMAYEKLGKTTASIEHYRKALSLNPENNEVAERIAALEKTTP